MKFSSFTAAANFFEVTASRFHNARSRGELIPEPGTRTTFDTNKKENVSYIFKIVKEKNIDPAKVFSEESLKLIKSGRLPKARLSGNRNKDTQGKSKYEVQKYTKVGKPTDLEKAIVAAGEMDQPKRKRKKKKSDDVDGEEFTTKEDLIKLAERKTVAEAKLKEEQLESARLKNEILKGKMVEKVHVLQMYRTTIEAIRNSLVSSVGKNIGERYNRIAVNSEMNSDRKRVFSFNELHGEIIQEMLKEALNIFEIETERINKLSGDD